MDNKANLRDVTFLLLVRVDSIHRLENLVSVLEFLDANVDTNIYVLEAAKLQNQILQRELKRFDNIIYEYYNDYDNTLYRTQILNYMIGEVKTKYLSVYDVDIIIDRKQLEESALLLRGGKADFVYPYDGTFLDTTESVRDLYMISKDINTLKDNELIMNPIYDYPMSGGAFFARTDSYKKSGGENEGFYGWGLEDGERIVRWSKLGFSVRRVSGTLYHLYHIRFNNSSSTKEDFNYKLKVKRDITSATKEEIIQKVSDWDNFFSKDNIKLVSIHSPMRSGSTLLKALIATRDEITDAPEIKTKAALHRRKRSCDTPMLVVKHPIHTDMTSTATDTYSNTNKNIILVRGYKSIADSIISVPENNMSMEDVYTYIDDAYKTIYSKVDKDDVNTLVVEYDNLINDPITETSKIFKFLDVKNTEGTDSYNKPDGYKWVWGVDDGSDKIKTLKVTK